MMVPRLLAAALLAAHGFIHVIGFVVPWRIAQVEGFAYRTTALGGSVELGATGVQVAGLAWLAIAVGFIVAAVGAWRGSAWALGLTVALAIASLAVCVLGLPETAAGIAVDVGILAAVARVTSSRRRSIAAAPGGSR
jgi:hypothetical protein